LRYKVWPVKHAGGLATTYTLDELGCVIVDRTNLERQDDDHGSARSDPVKFCSHIPGHIKQTKHRIAQQKIEATMTPEERGQEQEIQRRQLEEIFRVMEEQKDKFGVKDVADVQEQLKMYIQ